MANRLLLTNMCLLPRSFLQIALFLLALTASASAQLASTSPNAILADPDRFDGQAVTIRGTVTNLQERVSRAGNPYDTLDLSDGKQAIRIFSFGTSPCRTGAATVEGTFAKVKQQGRYTFYNEVTAARVMCRYGAAPGLSPRWRHRRVRAGSSHESEKARRRDGERAPRGVRSDPRLSLLSLGNEASADLSRELLERLVGYTIVAAKTISGWYDDDEREEGAFKGCRHGRVIVFTDGTGLTCSGYGYMYSYRPTAIILGKRIEYGARSMTHFKMIVEHEVFECGGDFADEVSGDLWAERK